MGAAGREGAYPGIFTAFSGDVVGSSAASASPADSTDYNVYSQIRAKKFHRRIKYPILNLGSIFCPGVQDWRHCRMCRNIKTLFNFEPPVTEEEIRAASLQFVRKITGFNKPSQANEAAFYSAVEDIAGISGRLLAALESSAPAKSREEEAEKAKARAAQRFPR
jgi:hypothetical protein